MNPSRALAALLSSSLALAPEASAAVAASRILRVGSPAAPFAPIPALGGRDAGSLTPEAPRPSDIPGLPGVPALDVSALPSDSPRSLAAPSAAAPLVLETPSLGTVPLEATPAPASAAPSNIPPGQGAVEHDPAPADGSLLGSVAAEARRLGAAPQAQGAALERIYELGHSRDANAAPDAGPVAALGSETSGAGGLAPPADAPALSQGPVPEPRPRSSLSRTLKVGLLSAALVLALEVGTMAAAAGLGYEFHSNYEGPDLPPGAGMLQAAGLVYSAVVLAPVAEEFLFRGILMGGLSRLGGWIRSNSFWVFWLPALLSSFVFDILHESADPVLFAARFVGTMVFARVFFKEGLLASTALHAFHNAALIVPFLLLALLPIEAAALALLALAPVGLAALAWSGWSLFKQRKDRKSGAVVPLALSPRWAAVLGAIVALGIPLIGSAFGALLLGATAALIWGYGAWLARRPARSGTPALTLGREMDPAQARRAALELYDSSLPEARPLWRRALRAAWTAGGLALLFYLVWVGPFAGPLWSWAVQLGAPAGLSALNAEPWLMLLRGVLGVEAIGYAYHRFFQHVGLLSRTVQLIRRNQMFHWVHHMIIYPIGRFYRRDRGYVPAEPPPRWIERLPRPLLWALGPILGGGLSWLLPGLLAGGAALWLFGLTWGAGAFILGIALHAMLLDYVHSRFHEERHPWTKWRYFNFLEDVHILHHWDQRYNFTILFPFMDMIFGTWLSPRRHGAEIAAAKEDALLTVSDFINWRYLLLEATPAERAAFISNARAHPASVRKLGQLLDVLESRLAERPEDEVAKDLRDKAVALLKALDTHSARRLLDGSARSK